MLIDDSSCFVIQGLRAPLPLLAEVFGLTSLFLCAFLLSALETRTGLYWPFHYSLLGQHFPSQSRQICRKKRREISDRLCTGKMQMFDHNCQNVFNVYVIFFRLPMSHWEIFNRLQVSDARGSRLRCSTTNAKVFSAEFRVFLGELIFG